MTASRPDTALPIDVRGDVRLDTPSGHRATLRATGSALYLDVPGWTDLDRLAPRSLMWKRRAVAAAIRSLDTLSLTLEVIVAGRRAFALGPGVKTTWSARLLGLGSADIRLTTIFEFVKIRLSAWSRPTDA